MRVCVYLYFIIASTINIIYVSIIYIVNVFHVIQKEGTRGTLYTATRRSEYKLYTYIYYMYKVKGVHGEQSSTGQLVLDLRSRWVKVTGSIF